MSHQTDVGHWFETEVFQSAGFSVCMCYERVFPSPKKKWFTWRGRDLDLWVFILIVFAYSLPQDEVVIAWLSRTKLYIFCYVNHYKQQLWKGTLGPVIILMKQKDCIPSEVNFSRSQIKMLSPHSKHAGNGAKTIGGSDRLSVLSSLQTQHRRQPGPLDNPQWPKFWSRFIKLII